MLVHPQTPCTVSSASPSQTAIGRNHWVGQGRNPLDAPLRFSTVKSSTWSQPRSQRWIEGAAQIRQRNLQCRVTPFPRKSAWKPQGKMTMSGDMSIVQHDEINSVLGSTERARWEEYCLELEVASFPKWKRACEPLEPTWVDLTPSRISRRRQSGNSETTGVRAYPCSRPTMAMSLDRPISQPITINLPTHNLEPEPVGPSSSRTSPQSSQQQSGEHAAELTPNAALVQPIAELSLPEDLSDSETVATEVSPRRRASVSTDNTEKTPDDTTKERARRSSAQ